MAITWDSGWFYGVKISDYELEQGYVSYETLAKAFDAVLNNDIKEITTKKSIGYWVLVSGEDFTGDNERDIFQYFIVSDNGAEILKDADEIVYYNETLDMYLWGVTHYGTAWSSVLTQIKIEINGA